MTASILNFTIVKSPETKYSDAQIFLREFTGNNYSRDEAEAIWPQVIDHKWNVSNNLRRDIGLRVAAIDFIENFHEPQSRTKSRAAVSKSNDLLRRKIKDVFRKFFEAKGQFINY